MRSFVCAAALTLTFSVVGVHAQSWFPAPGPGTPVSFVACPERTAGGSWVATDAASGYTYSLAGAVVPANTVIRVTGVVSPDLASVPGWLLTPIKIVAGQQPCRSAGVFQSAGRGLESIFGVAPATALPARY